MITFDAATHLTHRTYLTTPHEAHTRSLTITKAALLDLPKNSNTSGFTPPQLIQPTIELLQYLVFYIQGYYS